MPFSAGPVHRVTTTDNTPTLIRSQPLAVGSYRVFLYARQTGSPRADYFTTLRILVLFQDHEAAWASDGATLATEGSIAAVAAWQLNAAVVGANLEISVTGENAKNITWDLYLEHLQSP